MDSEVTDLPPALEGTLVIDSVPSQTPEKQPCPECGGLYMLGSGLTWHLRAAHGYKDGKPPKRPVGRPPGVPNKPKLVTPLQRPATLVSADEITEAAAALLWPDGIPPSALPSLLRWHALTVEFLADVALVKE